MSWRTPSRGLRPPLNPVPDEGPTPKAELYILKVPVGSEQVVAPDRRRLGPAAKAVRRLIARLQNWLASSLTSSPRFLAGLPGPPAGLPRPPVKSASPCSSAASPALDARARGAASRDSHPVLLNSTPGTVFHCVPGRTLSCRACSTTME